MNPQGKGKIEWTDQSWNPGTGCLHNCNYGPDGCYANKVATKGRAKQFYPNGFVPEWHPERLIEPIKLKKPSKIFVGDMTDQFGAWVPDEQIETILDIVKRCPAHTFQFLTKNPKRLNEWIFPSNCWLGTTWDGLPFTERNVDILRHEVHTNCIKFVSFEPLLAPFKGSLDGIDWIIIGELTGAPMTQDQIHEVRGWADDLILQAKMNGIPVFVKNALGAIYPQREFPR
jgi:protein gp37